MPFFVLAYAENLGPYGLARLPGVYVQCSGELLELLPHTSMTEEGHARLLLPSPKFLYLAFERGLEEVPAEQLPLSYVQQQLKSQLFTAVISGLHGVTVVKICLRNIRVSLSARNRGRLQQDIYLHIPFQVLARLYGTTVCAATTPHNIADEVGAHCIAYVAAKQGWANAAQLGVVQVGSSHQGTHLELDP